MPTLLLVMHKQCSIAAFLYQQHSCLKAHYVLRTSRQTAYLSVSFLSIDSNGRGDLSLEAPLALVAAVCRISPAAAAAAAAALPLSLLPVLLRLLLQ
jgi:hypothetical protein